MYNTINYTQKEIDKALEILKQKLVSINEIREYLGLPKNKKNYMYVQNLITYLTFRYPVYTECGLYAILTPEVLTEYENKYKTKLLDLYKEYDD